VSSTLSMRVALFALAFFGCKAKPAPVDAGSALEAARAKANVPGISIAVFENGSVARAETAGFANAEAKEALTVETRFEVASIGKPIVAIAVMQLVERNALALDEDVQAYLPFTLRNPSFPSEPPLSRC